MIRGSILGGAAIATGFRGRGQRPDNRRVPPVRINERIRVPEVRVIGEEGEQLGVMDVRVSADVWRRQQREAGERAYAIDPAQREDYVGVTARADQLAKAVFAYDRSDAELRDTLEAKR